MKNEAEKHTLLRQNYERKLEEAISKNGIEIIDNETKIDLISIAEPKGFYCVDDGEIHRIEMIMQEISTGKILVDMDEDGYIEFDFDFMGSKEECYKFILKERDKLKNDIASISVTVHTEKEDER